MTAKYNPKTRELTVTVTCDGEKDSSTGKSTIRASSGGYKAIEGTSLQMSLVIIEPKK